MTLPGRGPARAVSLLFGVFVALQILAAVVRADRHVLLWWEGAPVVFVAFSWFWALLRSVLAGAAAAWLAGTIAPILDGRRSERATASVMAGIAFVAGLGTALRFVAPVSIPPGVWVDVVLEAERLLRFPGSIPWVGGTPLGVEGAHEIVSHLLLRAYEGLFALFGRGDVGLLSLSAVPGALAVPAGAWLAYEAFGGRTAVVAGAFVALSSRSLALSRWGYTPATLVPLALATMAAALAARRRRSLLLAALSGVFAGLGMHTHSSSVIVPIALAAWSAGTWKEPGARARAGVAAIAAFLAAAPWLLGFVQHPGYVGGRLRDVNVANPVRDVHARDLGLAARFASNAVDYSGLFVFTSDPNGRHGFPDRPAVPVPVGIAVVLGVAVLVGRVLQDVGAPRALLWLAAGSLAAGVLSDPGGAPNTVRAAILVATGLVIGAWVTVRVAEELGRRLRVRPGALLALAVTGFCARETVPFLASWRDHGQVAIRFCPDESTAGRALRRLGTAPVILEEGVVSHAIVLETLAAPPDPALPVPSIPTASAAALLACPPPAPSFWIVGRADFPLPLSAAGWSVSRAVSTGPSSALYVFRVRRPTPPA